MINWLFVFIAIAMIIIGFLSYKVIVKSKTTTTVKEAQLDAIGLGKDANVPS